MTMIRTALCFRQDCELGSHLRRCVVLSDQDSIMKCFVRGSCKQVDSQWVAYLSFTSYDCDGAYQQSYNVRALYNADLQGLIPKAKTRQRQDKFVREKDKAHTKIPTQIIVTRLMCTVYAGKYGKYAFK